MPAFPAGIGAAAVGEGGHRAHDSATRRGAQIINPLGLGTASAYSTSWAWKESAAD